MDSETFNLLYNIGKTLSEGDGYCSKNGCSFNSDFLNGDNDDQNSISRKSYLKPKDDKSQDSHDDQSDKNDELGSEDFLHKPVLGSNLLSGSY